MRTLQSIHATVLLAVTAVLLTACDLYNPPAGESSRGDLPSDYTIYRNNGVSLSHPNSWSVGFDDKPGIYADREIGLNISDVSTFRVMVMEEDQPLHAAAGLFERQLRLNESKSVRGYERTPFDVNGQPAERLTWTQTMLEESEFELTIIDLPVKSGSAFAVFQLVEDDIENFQEDIIITVKSITIN